MNRFVVKRRPYGSAKKWQEVQHAPQTKKNALELAATHDRAFPSYEHAVFAWHTGKQVTR